MRRTLSLPIALAGGLLACGDALVQPAVPDHDAQRAALVAGESWEVFSVATSQDGYAYAAGINDSGVIVGYIDEGNVRAYRYSAGSMTTYLSPEGYISAQEINKSGQIVGSIRVTGTLRAYVRQADGSPTCSHTVDQRARTTSAWRSMTLVKLPAIRQARTYPRLVSGGRSRSAAGSFRIWESSWTSLCSSCTTSTTRVGSSGQ
jgi:probable HAF family extracellular repeat protein